MNVIIDFKITFYQEPWLLFLLYNKKYSFVSVLFEAWPNARQAKMVLNNPCTSRDKSEQLHSPKRCFRRPVEKILRREVLQTNPQSQVQVNDYKFLRLANWTRTTEIISSNYTQLQMFPWHTDSIVEKIA